MNFNLLSLIPLFGSVLYSFQRLLPLVQQIYATWANYRTKYPSICEVVEELENNKIKKEIVYSKKDFTFKKDIVLKSIDFSYEESNPILKDINLKINKGDHVGIYGETGSGKSTLLDILIGLIPPSKGSILIDNVDIYKEKSANLWTSKIAHVAQNIYLKEGTIAENIAYGESPNEINFDLLVNAAKSAQIYKFIEQSNKGFETSVGEGGIRLSGGQRQRIVIARALYRAREILILDEATSALDHRTEESIIESIKKHNDLTILMVTHRLKSLRICDRVLKVFGNQVFEEKK